LFLLIGGLTAFHRGRDFWAGVLLGLAIACKVTPALFLPYFLWKRSWKVLAGAAVGLALFLFVVPSCFLGWNDNLTQLTGWVNNMIVPYTVHGVVTPEHNNQSLPGLLQRMLTHSPSFSTYINHKDYTPASFGSLAAFQNVVSWDPAVVRLLVKGCMVLFA